MQNIVIEFNEWYFVPFGVWSKKWIVFYTIKDLTFTFIESTLLELKLSFEKKRYRITIMIYIVQLLDSHNLVTSTARPGLLKNTH